MDHTIELQRSVGGAWLGAKAIRIGRLDLQRPPDYYVTVDDGPASRFRIDLYLDPNSSDVFRAALRWKEFVVIGVSDHLFLVQPRHGTVQVYPLECYFSDLHATDESLFVASAERLRAFRADGSLAWSSEPIGIDGVVLHEISGTVIKGSGEWDPPGGWVSFAISAVTGESLPIETNE